MRASDGSGQVQEDVVTVDVLPPLAEAKELNGKAGAGEFGLLSPPAPFGHPSGQPGAELEADLETDEIVVGPGERGSCPSPDQSHRRGAEGGGPIAFPG